MKNFITVPNKIFNYDIKAREAFVYLYLKKCAGISSTCFPSIKDISKNCHMSHATTIAAIQKLESEGLIEIRHRYDGENNLSNLYTILKI